MTIPHRLSIVTLGARDLAALSEFYDGLGFETTIAMPTFRCYVLGGVGFALFSLEDLAEEAGAADATDPRDWRGVTLALNVDAASDVAPTWQAWVDAGATPITEPADREWGGRSGYVADPEGHRWEIAWAPGAIFDERGAFTGFRSS